MQAPPKHHRILFAAAVAILALAMVPLRGALTWYDHPFAGVLVDPDGVVSSFGLPTWDGFHQGLRYPDRIIEVDDQRLDAAPRYRADVWDDAVKQAFREGKGSVHVRASTSQGERELDLAIGRIDRSAFWLNGVAPLAIALLYVAGALVALGASPRGRLSRSFAKTSLFAALFLFTLFDYHTTRRLVPLFHLAFAMVPMGFFVLPLRLPDDVAWLRARPWIPAILDAVGFSLGLGMIVSHLSGGTTIALRSVCSALFGASFFFFAATFLIRFVRARGDRRATLRALLVAMVPAHVIIGSAFVLASLSLWGATSALLAVPALALTPLSTVFALIRHDLWGSRALLSRVLMRTIIVGLTCAVAVALGTAVATLFDVELRHALLAASLAGITSGLLVAPALRFGDDVLFPSMAAYKPTIEQLSEDLTAVTEVAEVGHAVERTVRRWLPCEQVEFRLLESSERTDPSPGGDHQATSGIRRMAVDPALALRDDLSIDVLFRGRVLAVLSVGKKRGGALFTSEDIDLLRTIANQAALALAHAESYAELEQRRKQQAAVWRGEREALVETVAAEIAHEVRYPINFFRSIFERGQGDRRLDAEDVDIGCDEVERLERLVSGLRRVPSRRLERRRVGVDDLVVKVERLLRDRLGERRLSVTLAGPPAIRCDPDQITQVLVNLLSNALDAAGDDGEVGVEWRGGREGATLVVWDTGPGIDDPARVFAPWYTTKPRGTGLGLAITHRLVRAHSWTIELERHEGRTRFVVAIPASDVSASTTSEVA